MPPRSMRAAASNFGERFPRGFLKIAVPLSEPLEGILYLRIEHQHRRRRIIHEELVNQTIIYLAREIP